MINKLLVKNAARIEVVAWNNAGARTAVPCVDLNEAKKLAKECRTLDNQTVKICDAFGTIFHWSRVVGVKVNRWFSRFVENDIFDG